MSKEAYYFSHDANARHDPKILAMRSEYGITGYGVYWIIIEMLREQDNYKLTKKPYIFNAIAMQVQCKDYAKEDAKRFVESCINDYDLFEQDDNFFWSNSLLKRMEKRGDLSEKRAAAAKARWDKTNNSKGLEKKTDANAMQMDANAMQTDAIKGKEKKENKIKDINKNIPSSNDDLENEFNEFWNVYIKKADKKKSFDKFKVKRQKFSFETIIEGTKAYMDKCRVENINKQYIKNPLTFLNGDCFNDEHEIQFEILDAPSKNNFGSYKTKPIDWENI